MPLSKRRGTSQIQFVEDRQRHALELSDEAREDFRQRVAALYAAGYGVGPFRRWFEVRDQALGLLQEAGLQRDGVVLDLGCGMLRLGSALIAQLDAGCYLGIEPDEGLIQAGIDHLVDADLIAQKRPRFYHGTDFRLSAFNQEVDFVIARSIWSHASRDMIRTTLDEFCKIAKPDATLFASFYEAQRWPIRRWPYMGKKWLYPNITKWGASYHRAAFIRRECRKRGLELTMRDDQEKLGRQSWAQITWA